MTYSVIHEGKGEDDKSLYTCSSSSSSSSRVVKELSKNFKDIDEKMKDKDDKPISY